MYGCPHVLAIWVLLYLSLYERMSVSMNVCMYISVYVCSLTYLLCAHASVCGNGHLCLPNVGRVKIILQYEGRYFKNKYLI